MRVKSKTQLKQALAKIMERAKVCRDMAIYDTDRRAYAEIVKECYEALDKPSAVDVSAYVNGREPNDLYKRQRKKETVPCNQPTCSSESSSVPSPCGTS